jgi:hypothetical protein
MGLQSSMKLPVLALTIGLLWLAAGCGDDDDGQSPVVTPFNFTIEDLPRLASGQYYEAWVTFPPPPPRAGRVLHGEDPRESLGQFVVTETGVIEAREGGPAELSYSGAQDVNQAVDVLISVETEGDTAQGPVLIAGVVVGNDDEGRSTLGISHHDAVGTDFSNASGSFILATPTNGEGTDENLGIWFTNPAGLPTLVLPLFGEKVGIGWIYQAYVFHGGHAIEIGTFNSTDVEDSDGRGAEAGPMPGFNAPGSDFLQSQHNLSDGSTVAFVVIQPAGDVHERGARALHDDSFPMRILETTIPLDATPRQSINLGPRVAPWPTATVTFPR